MKIIPAPTNNQIQSFSKSLIEERANSTRVITALAGILFIIYSVFDYFGLPREALSIIYPVRLVNTFVLVGVFYLSFKPVFLNHYSKILLFGYYSSGATISIGVYLSKSAEYSYDSYFAAFIVLIISCFSWSYISIRQSSLMGLIFVFVYASIKIFVHKTTDGAEFLTLIAHLFFLVSVGVIAGMAQYIRDSLIYRNLQLQENLKIIIEEKSHEAQKQKRLANLDALTGIPNRRYITKKLKKAISEADRSHTQLTLLYIDINGFKLINDDYGHDSGDKVLEITAKRLQQIVRKSDCLARLGGDEFLVGFKVEKTSDEFIENMIKNIKDSIGASIASNGNLLKVGVSVGCANYPTDAKNIEELIKAADTNMYKDKNIGRKSQIS